MRRHILAGAAIFVLAVLESALLPRVLGALPRPGLVLIVSSAWAAIRGTEGIAWAFWGGLVLDGLSALPLGLNTLALMLGNAVGYLASLAQLPFQWLRVVIWVAIATMVYHAAVLLVINLSGQTFELARAIGTVIVPLLVINPALSLLAMAVLNRLQQRLRTQEQFFGT